ncbi:MAG: phosphoglycerate kinase [Chloroflexi bacterium]|nr:phosphoglycerate kinase [Chloroflexota bacterium]
MNKRTIADIDVAGRRVLVRVDFNVPLNDGRVGDDTRIRATLPTIRYLIDRHARVVLMSHLGRPKGLEPKLSLAPVAARLAELLGQPVRMAPDCVGGEVERMASALKPGEALMLENLRFHKEEEKNDPAFAKQLAALGEIYVNDAFGTAHRAHASTEGVTHYLPAVAGFLMENELNFLGGAMTDPARPFVAILGGAKVSDKIEVLTSLLQKADRVLVGGGMANTFAKAQGCEMGDSLVEDDKLDVARQLMRQAQGKLVFPVDAVIADRFDKDAAAQTVEITQVSPGWRVLDIGPRTVGLFAEQLRGARTIVWNGPLGVFEFPRFAQGTMAMARALADSGATTIVGGGESVAAVEQAGVAGRISHISTGGGASLEFLEGKILPGVAALQDKSA